MSTTITADPLGRRRSTRVLVKIQLILRAAEASGETFETSAETLLVNKHGARVRTERALRLGMQIAITVQGTGRWQFARVVWEDNPGENNYGIELHSPENLWGISFPPDDWGVETHSAAAGHNA